MSTPLVDMACHPSGWLNDRSSTAIQNLLMSVPQPCSCNRYRGLTKYTGIFRQGFQLLLAGAARASGSALSSFFYRRPEASTDTA